MACPNENDLYVTTCISHKQDMVDVLPSSMWYLMWWASTPFAIGRACSHAVQEEYAPGPEASPRESLEAAPHWSQRKKQWAKLYVEIVLIYIHCLIMCDPIFPTPVSRHSCSHHDQVLFVCFESVFMSDWDRQTYRGGSRGDGRVGFPSTQCLWKAQGLFDPPMNFQGGCRGHRRGQRSAFMLITNNALLCQQHRGETVTTGCSYEPEWNYAKTGFHFIFLIFWAFMYWSSFLLILPVSCLTDRIFSVSFRYFLTVCIMHIVHTYTYHHYCFYNACRVFSFCTCTQYLQNMHVKLDVTLLHNEMQFSI